MTQAWDFVNAAVLWQNEQPDTPEEWSWEMPIRVYNALKNAHVCTLDDLTRMSAAELLRLPNFGKKSLKEVERYLQAQGRNLSG